MPTTTANYGLVKPGQNENYDVDVQNGNMDKIDAELRANQQATAAAQATADAAIPASQKGQALGVPTLDGNRLIPAAFFRTASSETLGAVKIGSGFQFASDGTIAVTPGTVGAVATSLLGQASGVATLGADGKLTTGQIPSAATMGVLPIGTGNTSVRIDPAFELSSDTRSVTPTYGANGMISDLTVSDPATNAIVAAKTIGYGSNGLISKVTTTAGGHTKTVTINYGTNGLFSSVTKTYT
ncbi:hypothetical protein [Tumebacillus flagellatus]|uniref:Uncharacterized protein n=1 Tax=Tumebacillus flagellatus TaxID=1157490 RepID=A0A074M4U5_9BACL|nr:hypothetical protein [Tumebacillus flagellatus]KEO81027.1 hypothetical protein EL26_22880 [Tumebacillus flagellatus]